MLADVISANGRARKLLMYQLVLITGCGDAAAAVLSQSSCHSDSTASYRCRIRVPPITDGFSCDARYVRLTMTIMFYFCPTQAPGLKD